MKHEMWELKQMQAMDLESKIAMTKTRVKAWYQHWNGNVYISWSGGKDSTVMKHIIDSMGYDIPSVYVNTGLEYPEITKFVRAVKNGEYSCFSTNVDILSPKMRFDKVIEEYGYPVISKEVASNVAGARKYLKLLADGDGRHPIPYSYNYRRITGTGEYDKQRLGQGERKSAETGDHNGNDDSSRRGDVP